MTARQIKTCAHCGQSYRGKTNQRFCSDKCRYAAWAHGGDVVRCTYCGLPGECTDHVPPRAYRRFIAMSPGLSAKYPFQEVPACRECNSALGAKAFWTIKERKDYVKKYLRRRYGDGKFTEWSDEELEELGYNLRTMVEEQNLLREINAERLKY